MLTFKPSRPYCWRSYLTACRLWPPLLSPPAFGLCQKQKQPLQEFEVWSADQCRNQTWRQSHRENINTYFSHTWLLLLRIMVQFFFRYGMEKKKDINLNFRKSRVRFVWQNLESQPIRPSSVFLPLGLPVDEAERGVKKPAHLSQRPLSVNTEEEVLGWGVLGGRVHQLSRPTNQIKRRQISNRMVRN